MRQPSPLPALIVAVGLCLTAAHPALAAEVSLRSDIADADGRVTLGELFDGAGAAAGVVVASRPGPSVVLDAAAIQSLARRSGLSWSNPQGLRRIIVRAGASEAPATTQHGNVEVLAWARGVNTGEIIQPQDLIWAKAAGAPSDAARDADAVVGMAARRPLREGSVVTLRDVTAQQVIAAGDLVQVTWSAGGVTLTLQAKALANAAVGQSFTAQNPVSKKVIEAVAIGPGQAVTGPEAQRLKAASPAQFAAR